MKPYAYKKALQAVAEELTRQKALEEHLKSAGVPRKDIDARGAECCQRIKDIVKWVIPLNP